MKRQFNNIVLSKVIGLFVSTNQLFFFRNCSKKKICLTIEGAVKIKTVAGVIYLIKIGEIVEFTGEFPCQW